MIVDQPVSNPNMALFHATQIAKLRSLGPQANIDSALMADLPNNFSSVFFPPSGQMVAMYIGGDNSRKVVYLDGITTLGQAAALVDGYWTAFMLPGSPPLNAWFQSLLPTIMGRIALATVFTPEYLDVVGYSAGGALATAVMYQLKRQQTTMKMKLITFGSPRPGGRIVRDTIASSPVARWMTPGDPIPLIPPRIQDANALALAFSPVQWITFSNTVHTHGGLEVNAAGEITDAVLPSQAVVNASSSLASWFLAENDDTGNDHAIFRYMANLQAALSGPPGTRPHSVDVGPAEVPDDNKRRGVNQERDRVITAISDQQGRQNIQPVVVPGPVLFTPVRLGRVWAVGFGDQIVAQGVHEKTCRHICRAGNDFLRSLPKQAIVDVTALQGQLEAFLALAQDPSQGFSPTIKTTLNQQ
jgi:hypothetical protein